jgi:hypothetical protein
MRFRTVMGLVVVAVLLPTLVVGQTKKKKKSLPAVFGNAHYVYVQAEDGDAYTPGVQNEDLRAITDVQDGIQKWNRYSLAATASDAELVFFVRKGRLVSGRLGGTVGAENSPYPGQPRTTSGGATAGAEAGPPDDLLEVRMRNGDGSLSGPIWIRTEPEGLDRPHLPLLQQLREAVERDYPQ